VDAPTGRLLTASDVVAIFQVDPRTVARWARTGQLRCIRLPSGRRRFYESDVEAFLKPQGGDQ